MWSDMLEKRRHDRLPLSPAVARPVTEVGLLAQSVLQSGSDGVVMAAFQRCFYAAFGDSLICVGSHALGSRPLHVLCDRWQDDLVGVGQPVAIEGPRSVSTARCWRILKLRRHGGPIRRPVGRWRA